jgi:DNA-binding MarR family transcriptional regulator
MSTGAESDDSQAVAYEILRDLRRILRRVTLHSKYLGREAGLTLPQIVCLLAISETAGGEVTAAQISDKVQLSPPTVTGILDRLQRAGLISRERGTTDRRKVFVSLTDLGKDRLAAVPAPLQDRFVKRVMALSGEQRTALLESLRRLVTLFEAEDVDPAPLPGEVPFEGSGGT